MKYLDSFGVDSTAASSFAIAVQGTTTLYNFVRIVWKSSPSRQVRTTRESDGGRGRRLEVSSTSASQQSSISISTIRGCAMCQQTRLQQAETAKMPHLGAKRHKTHRFGTARRRHRRRFPKRTMSVRKSTLRILWLFSIVWICRGGSVCVWVCARVAYFIGRGSV